MKTSGLLPVALACSLTAAVLASVGDASNQGQAAAAPQPPVAPMPSAPAT